MHIFHRWSVAILLAAAISAPALLSGCSGHVRVYDAYYHDYHPWNHHEAVLYGQWETETHRDHHDFNSRSADEQHQYWDWRHKH